jgi:hypothetical protein
MLREGLLAEVRSAINQARAENRLQIREDIPVLEPGRTRHVKVEVIPFKVPPSGVRFLLVLFQDRVPPEERPAGAAAAGVSPVERHALPAEQQVFQLQQELNALREYLQSVIEEQESTNEELKSANEDILSTNEELQSTNEELQTAKEEAQSANEELATVNDELRHRNAELVHQPVTREAGMEMTDPIERSEEAVERDRHAQVSNRRRRALSVFTCPECGGSLWQVDEKELLRFRCHVGHIYLGEALLAEHTAALEAALWTAVGTFKDKSVLARQLAARHTAEGHPESAARFEDDTCLAEQYSGLIQQYLLEGANGGPAGPGPPAPEGPSGLTNGPAQED